jgi:hypothetical protein
MAMQHRACEPFRHDLTKDNFFPNQFQNRILPLDRLTVLSFSL